MVHNYIANTGYRILLFVSEDNCKNKNPGCNPLNNKQIMYFEMCLYFSKNAIVHIILFIHSAFCRILEAKVYSLKSKSFMSTFLPFVKLHFF